MLEKLDKKSALELLGDDYITDILSSTHIKPKSAKEISKRNDIPIAICYRRINKLVKLGFLSEDKKALTQEGKRVQLYKSNLKSAHVYYEEGKLKAKFEFKDGQLQKFGDKIKEKIPSSK